MARGREEEKGCVMRLTVLLCVLVFLSGCETLNEAAVRFMFIEHGVSRKMSDQIREGLERRKVQPAETPVKTAPPFLDQG